MVITELSANELSQAIHAKEVSCVEVMQAYLQRIDQVNPHFNALVSLQDPSCFWPKRLFATRSYRKATPEVGCMGFPSH